MSLSARLELLEKKHRELDARIQRENSHYFADDVFMNDLKKKKLRIKEEIERIRETA